MQEELDYRVLIIKFLAKEISDNELDVLKGWLKEDPANRRIFNEENEIWQKTGLTANLDNYKTDKTWSEISKNLGIDKTTGKTVVILNKINYKILIAATFLACMVAIGELSLWLTESSSDKQIADASTTVCTGEGEKVLIFLSDSTQVFMNSESTLEYSRDYNIKQRIVKLSGEAFFDVRTNPGKPFVVQLDKISVSAKGTRFNILSYKNENRIETTLEEGNIQVVITEQKKIDLKTGNQLVYYKKEDKAIIKEVSTETYTSWRENKLKFIDTPFEEVLRKIARRYNVTFEIRNHDLLGLKYTATFIDESIDEVMRMLKEVSPITYKIYKRTTIKDMQYLKPKIVVEKRKT